MGDFDDFDDFDLLDFVAAHWGIPVHWIHRVKRIFYTFKTLSRKAQFAIMDKDSGKEVDECEVVSMLSQEMGLSVGLARGIVVALGVSNEGKVHLNDFCALWDMLLDSSKLTPTKNDD